MITTSSYKFKPWTSDDKLSDQKYHKSWSKIIKNEMSKPYFEKINSKVATAIEKGTTLYPYPTLVFKAFECNMKKVKVVILGQDPYPNNDVVPNAMGLSFSVPKGNKIPSSLKNIYKNLEKFDHVDKKPSDGNLESWAKQGVLLLNTALTVPAGKANAHARVWRDFTDEIISQLSKQLDNVVFILWGANALKKLSLIDTDKHMVSISSHPSGLSYTKPMKQYQPFIETDHFGQTNKYLKSKGLTEIKW